MGARIPARADHVHPAIALSLSTSSGFPSASSGSFAVSEHSCVCLAQPLRVDGGVPESEPDQRTMQKGDGRPDGFGDWPFVRDERRPHEPSIVEPKGVVRAEEAGAELAHGFVGTAVDDVPAEDVISRTGWAEPKPEDETPPSDHEPSEGCRCAFPCRSSPLLRGPAVVRRHRDLVRTREVGIVCREAEVCGRQRWPHATRFSSHVHTMPRTPTAMHIAG